MLSVILFDVFNHHFVTLDQHCEIFGLLHKLMSLVELRNRFVVGNHVFLLVTTSGKTLEAFGKSNNLEHLEKGVSTQLSQIVSDFLIQFFYLVVIPFILITESVQDRIGELVKSMHA